MLEQEIENDLKKTGEETIQTQLISTEGNENRQQCRFCFLN